MKKNSPSIFISYSHKDENWKDRLVRQVDVLQFNLSQWSDRPIASGYD